MPRVKLRSTEQRVLYTLGEVARMTGRGRSTIYRWLDAGVLESVRIPGGDQMISAASLERLIKGDAPRRRRKATASPAPTP